MTYSIEQRDDQLANSRADITYTLSFDRAPQHIVHVRMRVENVVGDELVVAMSAWAPGSYKIRDYAGWQGNVAAFGIDGTSRTELATKWRDKSSLVISTGGALAVEIDYVIYGHERTVRTNHINRFHAFILPIATCMYVEGRMDETHHVVLKLDRTLWPNVSTQLSPVTPRDSSGVVLGALNFDILADSPIEIGDHAVRSFQAAGASHELAVCGNHSVDMDWFVEQLQRIVTVEAKIFGGVPYDRYVFIVWLYPGIRGGLEHARSSVNAEDPATVLDKAKTASLLSLLTHEFFHLWNVKRIRPKELGPFDYQRENYTPMLWLSEGLTSYYDDHIAFRCGFLSEKEYVDKIAKEHIGKLLRVPGRFKMSVRDSSFLAWVKLYTASPDGGNRFPSYYLKGGVVFLLLDLYIIGHTDGRATLDDGLRAMWETYKADPSKGMTEAECIAILERSTGVQVREVLLNWLDGTQELPMAELLQTVGLELDLAQPEPKAITFGDSRVFASVPPPKFYGWTLGDSDGRVKVRSIEDGGPAQLAGIGVDDEIVAIDGKHVTSTITAEKFLSEDTTSKNTLTCQCDGRMFSTEMNPIPMPSCKINDVAILSKRQKTLRAAWLERIA